MNTLTPEELKRIEQDPLFKIGKVPKIPHCLIQDMHYDGREWNYYIYNQYNSYASGWATEDKLIQQIKEHGE